MKKEKLYLSLMTFSQIVGFMAWVIISSLIVFIKGDIPLTASQLTLLTATPVVLGSILRIPLGYLTNLYGARKIFGFSLLIVTLPVYYLSIAHSFTGLLISAIFVGIGGAVFSIGVTSIPKYFPKEKHGLVNGIYGLGNIGTAVSTFSAPVVASQIGWRHTVQMLIVFLILLSLLNWLFGDKKEEKLPISFLNQAKQTYRNQKFWFFSIFYFITFGSFVAFTVYLPNFLVTNFGLGKVDAGMRTAGFIVLATLIRPIGGWLADRFNPYKLLIIAFLCLSVSAIILSFSPNIVLYTIGCLCVSFFAGIGNGTIFKLVPQHFSKQAGFVNGFIAAAGGLGGFSLL